jgi:type IV secretory pathway VirB2 component (pilin)
VKEGRTTVSVRIEKFLTSLYARKRAIFVASTALTATPLYAQQVGGGSPWENAVAVLEQAFTGPIATGLSLVAIVLGGLMFAYGEGQSKRMLAGIVFGIGMAIGAVNFMAWLFP